MTSLPLPVKGEHAQLPQVNNEVGVMSLSVVVNNVFGQGSISQGGVVANGNSVGIAFDLLIEGHKVRIRLIISVFCYGSFSTFISTCLLRLLMLLQASTAELLSRFVSLNSRAVRA